MKDIRSVLEKWNLSIDQVRRRMYRAPTPRERERWHAIFLSAKGWTAGQVAEELDRDQHTVGGWLDHFRQRGPSSLVFEQTGGAPPRSTRLSKSS